MIRWITTLALIFSTAVVFAAGDETSPLFGRVKLELAMEDAPVFNFRSTTSSVGGALQLTNRRWLVLRAEFYPGVAKIGEKMSSDDLLKVSVKPAKGSWYDDVTVTARVLFPAEYERSGGKKTVDGLFVGHTKLWTVQLDAAKHSLLMAVPPQLIERYFAVRRNSTREQTAVKGDFKAEMTFTSRAGKLLGVAYFNLTPARNQTMTEAFAELAGAVPSRFVIDGGVFSRERTPWFYVTPENYDIIKSASSENTANGKGE